MADPQLKKRLGQHHLTDPRICRPLLDFLVPQGRSVIEIGPGGGVLTGELLNRSAGVVAIEIDPEWGIALRRRMRHDRLQIVIADALEFPWAEIAAGTLVAGNLPYQISTALIERLLPLWRTVPRAGFLVQREVGERLVARPGDSDYGSLGVLTGAYAQAKLLRVVARGSFNPPPKVEGAFVGLELRRPPLPDGEMPEFVNTVRAAFALRRKTLRNALAARWGRDRAASWVSDLGCGDRIRAEELDLDGFLTLHRLRVAE